MPATAKRTAKKPTPKSTATLASYIPVVHTPPPLRSSVDGLEAVRISGVTYLVRAGTAEAFRSELAKAAKANA